MTSEYAFEIRAQQWSRDSYYVSSSAQVYELTVVASTKDEAVAEAKRLLGEPERSRYWRMWVDRATDVRLASVKEAAA